MRHYQGGGRSEISNSRTARPISRYGPETLFNGYIVKTVKRVSYANKSWKYFVRTKRYTCTSKFEQWQESGIA
ncbi:hypothetical protein P879_09558 [Paragonimus westermani]|uniref:Uncharacterized protein n=1 Tax=Paragonimus westermani TaxID=34504 RepID=A0A8T0DJ95_9TREM|nr:hypothetical protein P879_09558 [Paragonimus westermani]